MGVVLLRDMLSDMLGRVPTWRSIPTNGDTEVMPNTEHYGTVFKAYSGVGVRTWKRYFCKICYAIIWEKNRQAKPTIVILNMV